MGDKLYFFAVTWPEWRGPLNVALLHGDDAFEVALRNVGIDDVSMVEHAKNEGLNGFRLRRERTGLPGGIDLFAGPTTPEEVQRHMASGRWNVED